MNGCLNVLNNRTNIFILGPDFALCNGKEHRNPTQLKMRFLIGMIITDTNQC